MDDHHTGGTFKHVRMRPELVGGATASIVGYNGLDELRKLCQRADNASLSTLQFLDKYLLHPFTASAVVAPSMWCAPLSQSFAVNITFDKEMINHPACLQTWWAYNSLHDAIEITFDDKVLHDDGWSLNKWRSTPFVHYEHARAFETAAAAAESSSLSDRCVQSNFKIRTSARVLLECVQHQCTKSTEQNRPTRLAAAIIDTHQPLPTHTFGMPALLNM